MTAAAAKEDLQCMYVGDAVSAQVVAGQEITLTPGKIVSVPGDDETVKRLLAQGLLIPYAIKSDRHDQ